MRALPEKGPTATIPCNQADEPQALLPGPFPWMACPPRSPTLLSAMRPRSRPLTVLLLVLALALPAVSAAGCGAGGHYLGGVLAHHAANHFVHSYAGRRRVNKLFCLYHGHRVLVDVRNHHLFAAGLNALAALHSCRGGFGRRRY